MNLLSTVQGKDLQPSPSSSSAMLRICFLLFMFFANIIVMNIFVGVSINNFKQIRMQVTGEVRLSREEKEWRNVRRRILMVEVEKGDVVPGNMIRGMCYRMVRSCCVMVVKLLQLLGLLLLLSFVTTTMSL